MPSAFSRSSRPAAYVCAALTSPSGVVVAVDLWQRHAQLTQLGAAHLGGWLGTCLTSLIFWATFLLVASLARPRWRPLLGAAFIGTYALTMGTAVAFMSAWNSSFTRDTTTGITRWIDLPLGGQPLGEVFPYITFFAGLAAIMLWLANQTLPSWLSSFSSSRAVPRHAASLAPLLVPLFLVAIAFLPVSYRPPQSTLPDINYLNGVMVGIAANADPRGGLRVHRMQRRSPEAVPKLTQAPIPPRNIVLILQESVRYDVVCSAYTSNCSLPGRHTNKVVPARIPLLQMRANASSTLIGQQTILTGLDPTSPRPLMESAANAFEFGAAAGYEGAYWTSQNVLVAGHRFFTQDSPLRFHVVGSHLDPRSSVAGGASEHTLVDRVINDFSHLREPFFAMVQFSATHQPYWYDKKDAPFKKPLRTENGSKVAARYLNSVYASDKQVARLVKAIRSSPGGDRTIILYTSDHGESFGKNARGGHTNTLFESEIRVPMWIDAPGTTLKPEERENLVKAREQFVWHQDLSATIFDLMGIWGTPAFAPFQSRMPGHPITRSERTTAPVAITNCSWVWGCKHPNFGMMQGTKKVYANYFDKGDAFTCFDLARDPWEDKHLPEAACGELGPSAHELYGTMPNRLPRITKQDW